MEWIKRSEESPTISGNYICLIKHRGGESFVRIISVNIDENNNVYWNVDKFTKAYCDITHWFPIPSLPID